MQPPDASDDLIVSMPERVAFQYEIAGIGSRFLAQVVDVVIITMFSNRRAKRLGDFAAGTLVVRDRERISLYNLGSTATNAPTPTPPPVASIWSTPEGSEAP